MGSEVQTKSTKQESCSDGLLGLLILPLLFAFWLCFNSWTWAMRFVIRELSDY